MLDPAVVALLGRLADEGITVFVPEGAEHMLHIEDGNLVIYSEVLEIVEVIHCLKCGYQGEEEYHVCAEPVASLN